MSQSRPKVLFTDVTVNAPAPIGHYSHVSELPNGTVLLSGQKAWRPLDGKLIDGPVNEQTKLIFENIYAILDGVGLPRTSLVRLSCYLSKLSDYEVFNETYRDCLGEHKPARTVLAGFDLRGGALVEIVAEAYRANSE